MATPVHFDPQIGEQFLRYARLVASRGYVHNTLGNVAIRVAHPDYPHGVAYTKHAEISLEEMGSANIVITDIPSSRLPYGSRMTSIGHNLNREILRRFHLSWQEQGGRARCTRAQRRLAHLDRTRLPRRVEEVTIE
jgi:hypothetical protein